MTTEEYFARGAICITDTDEIGDEKITDDEEFGEETDTEDDPAEEESGDY